MNLQQSPIRHFNASEPRRMSRACADLQDGFRRWRLACALAWGDIKNRYRGSILGPFWVTLTTAAMVVALGFFYSFILKVDPGAYFPWLAISLILWSMISQAVSEGADCFTSVESMIRQMQLPFTVHVLRCVIRNLLIMVHNVPLILVVMFLFDVFPGFAGLAFFVGLMLFLFSTFWVAFFLGIICARYRDVPPIIASLMQLFFFITPVIWLPEQLGERVTFLSLNPFYSIMETMRAPLLGRPIVAEVWLQAFGYASVLWGLGLAFFVRFRGRIAFWI
jgi:lipopolysaccharide transport system permease protein